MAEYHPSAPVTLVADEGYDNGDEDQYFAGDADGEEEEGDDDYDPTSFNFGDGAGDDAHVMHDSEQTALATSAQEQPPKQPQTVGGFIVDDEDEEEAEDAAPPPPSQLNGIEGAQSGLGAVAVSEAATDAAAQNMSIASEPAQEDPSSASAQSAPLNGSSLSNHPISTAPTSNAPPSAPAPAPSISAPVLQSPTTDQGKQQASISAVASALPSATATPQPPSASAAPPPQTNGSVPPTPTTQRLPHDKVGQLEDRIKEDPKADTEAWRSLIQHYRDKGQLENARKVYSRFFDVFPSAVCTLRPSCWSLVPSCFTFAF